MRQFKIYYVSSDAVWVSSITQSGTLAKVVDIKFDLDPLTTNCAMSDDNVFYLIHAKDDSDQGIYSFNGAISLDWQLKSLIPQTTSAYLSASLLNEELFPGSSCPVGNLHSFLRD